MRITLTETDCFGLELSGIFSLDGVSAERVLSRLYKENGIPLDKKLLDWVTSISGTEDDICMPIDSPEFERMLYILEEMVTQNGDVMIHCSNCDKNVSSKNIIKQEKDFSTETSGMRMGFAGDLYSCPKQHGLLFVMKKIF